MNQPKPTLLTEAEINDAIAELAGWKYRDGALHKTFSFKHFRAAFSFMCEVALTAEAMNHHPDWQNSYNNVTISLCTHSAGGVSELDITLACKIAKISTHP